MFVMANVTGAILGCDFFQHFNIALDFSKRELIFQSDSKPNIVLLTCVIVKLVCLTLKACLLTFAYLTRNSCIMIAVILFMRNKMAVLSQQWKAISQLIGRSKRSTRHGTIRLLIRIKNRKILSRVRLAIIY